MAETFDKNMIDKDEYPATAAIEQRCVCMVADLFHAEGSARRRPVQRHRGVHHRIQRGGHAGRAGDEVALAAERVGEGLATSRTPNLVMGSNVQVVWEKFCRYFDVEPRYLPMEEGRYVITPEQVLENVDEDTIGVVAILGTTFTGELEPIAEICAALDKLAAGGRTRRARARRRGQRRLRRAVPASRPRSGTSGCRGWCRSTSAATSTA